MQVEVDQSGKIGQTSVDTVLAFSNGKSFALLIPRKVKQQCLVECRRRKLSPKIAYTRLFTIALYLLLRKHIQQIPLAIIDMEYPGKAESIKEHLFNLFRRRGTRIEGNRITFDYIGKNSNAHHIALSVFRRQRRPDMTVRLDDILREL